MVDACVVVVSCPSDEVAVAYRLAFGRARLPKFWARRKRVLQLPPLHQLT